MTVAVVTTPRGAAVTPLTNKTNVANEHSSDVTVIDGATNTIITTVLAGTNPIGVAGNPVTNQNYLGHEVAKNLPVNDGAPNTPPPSAPGLPPPPAPAPPPSNHLSLTTTPSPPHPTL